MRKVIGGAILLMVLSMAPSVTVQANSLSYIQPSEVDGIPTEIKEYAEIIGNEFNICPELLMALAERESRFQPTVTNGSCKGLMQVSVSCHKQRFIDAGWSVEEWDDPYKNMYVAGEYLHELFEEYEDVSTVLALYHGEKNAVSKTKKGQLSGYVLDILTRSEELERVHGK